MSVPTTVDRPLPALADKTTCHALVAGLNVRVDVTWSPAVAGVRQAFAAHAAPPSASPDITIRVVPNQEYHRASEALGAPAFETVYGRFLLARWSLGDTTTVTVAPNRSPLRAIRPLVDLEGHPIHRDTGRILIERVLTTYVQLCAAGRLSYVHGAAMADHNADGLLISGHGGVGKTSLALELGLHHGWRFVSDDMVPLDVDGTMHLNANEPKIYGYNVQGDAALEERLLAGRSRLDVLHWRVRRRFPSHVRRAIDPARLYGGILDSARLRWMLMVERSEVDRIRLEPVTADEAAEESALVLVEELRKSTPDVTAFLRGEGAGRPDLAWGAEAWAQTLRPGFEAVQINRVLVPRTMKAIPYRQAMVGVVGELTGCA